MSIITARERLMELADQAPTEIGLEILEIIDTEMFRAPPIRKAARRSTPLTPELRREIIAYANAHLDANFHEIASHFNVSIGRVSEALNRVFTGTHH